MMKDEWRMMKDERWMMKDDDFKLLKGFALWRTDRRTDICNCRVAFATENIKTMFFSPFDRFFIANDIWVFNSVIYLVFVHTLVWERPEILDRLWILLADYMVNRGDGDGPEKIGGEGETVEIDESLFGKR